MARAVSSLKDLQRLVRESDGAEAVEVKVVGPLQKLGDAPGINNLLQELRRDLKWRFSGVDKLQPLIPVAIVVQEASKVVCELLPYFGVNKDGLTLSTTAREVRRRANRLQYTVEDLKRVAEDAKGLRAATDSLTNEIEVVIRSIKEGVKEVRAGSKKSIGQIHRKLRRCKTSCARFYNQVTELDEDGDN